MTTAEAPTRGAHENVRVRRQASDLIKIVLGLALLGLLTLAASRTALTRFEVDIFRLINDLDPVVEPALAAVMQAGALAAVVVASGAALAFRRWRAARDIAVAGTAAWFGAKLLKSLVGRDRPGGLLDGVVMRGSHSGLGFPSGHTAVAAAIAAALSPFVSRPIRRMLWLVVALVGIARIYVGAHLPLDVAGGWSLGWTIGSLVHVGFGTVNRRASADAVRRALESTGRHALRVSPLEADARGSTPFVATTEDGQTLFVKALSRDERNADWLFKGARYLLLRRTEDESPFATPKQQLEHEAYLGLLARRAGVHVPEVVDLISPDPDVAFLVLEPVDGESAANDPARLTPAVVRTVWQEVALLHGRRIAHRDLRLANIVVSRDGMPWIVDFGFAESSASARRMALDVAELLVSLASVVGVSGALDPAIECLDRSELAHTRRLLQPAALSNATRGLLREHPALLEDLDDALGDRLGEGPVETEPILRFRPRLLLGVIAIGFAIHVFLPRIAELETTWRALRNSEWTWVVVALVASAVTYLGAATSLVAACVIPLSYLRTLVVVTAASFTNRLAPSGLGRMGLDVRYIERQGASRPVALNTEALNSLAGLIFHVGALAVIGLVFGRNVLQSISLPSQATIVAVVALIAAVVGVLLAVGPWRRTVASYLAQARRALREEAHRPAKLVALFAGAGLLNVAYILALDASMRAVGAGVAAGTVAFVYLGGVAVASASPTPSGLGAEEAALVAAFAASGVQTSLAVAGVLLFRLVTFWLPIVPGWFAFHWLRRRRYV